MSPSTSVLLALLATCVVYTGLCGLATLGHVEVAEFGELLIAGLDWDLVSSALHHRGAAMYAALRTEMRAAAACGVPESPSSHVSVALAAGPWLR